MKNKIDFDRITNILIGNNPDDITGFDITINIENPAISKYHATIKRIKENEYFLEDDNSTNGTSVNGWRIKSGYIYVNESSVSGHKESDLLAFGDTYIDLIKEIEDYYSRKIENVSYKEFFLQLKKTYDIYTAESKRADIKHKLINVIGIRVAIMASVYLLGQVIYMYYKQSQMPDGEHLPDEAIKHIEKIGQYISSFSGFIGLGLAIAFTPNKSKKIESIQNKYLNSYKCKCGSNLSKYSWDELARRKRCPICNISFLKYN